MCRLIVLTILCLTSTPVLACVFKVVFASATQLRIMLMTMSPRSERLGRPVSTTAIAAKVPIASRAQASKVPV